MEEKDMRLKMKTKLRKQEGKKDEEDKKIKKQEQKETRKEERNNGDGEEQIRGKFNGMTEIRTQTKTNNKEIKEE